MLEAVVGVALRAILASVVLGGGLALCVLAATRTLALTAATRHALWTTALIAIGVMPLAGIGVSLARAELAHQTPAPSWSSPFSTAQAAFESLPRSAAVAPAAAADAKPPPPTTTVERTTIATTQPPGWTAPETRAQSAATSPSAADRFAFARNAVAHWTPRLSRTLALSAVAVWGAGALIGLIGLAASIARVRGLKRRSSPLDGALADELPWLTEVGPGREIYLRLSYETETPVAIGFRRPVILIPTELATTGGLAAIESLILHEYAHLRRHDDWTNLVQRVIERLFWFNPIVWVIGRRIALEREIASDDAVVEKTGEAHEYATSLWKLAREMRMPEHAVVAPGALLTRKQISVRIEQLLDTKRARLHRSPAAAFAVSLAALLAVTVVATSAPAVELPSAPVPIAFFQGPPFDAPAWKTPAQNAARSIKTVAAAKTPYHAPAAPHHTMPHVFYDRVLVRHDAAATTKPAQHGAKHAAALFVAPDEAASGPLEIVLPVPVAGENVAQIQPHLSSEIRRAMREAMNALPAHLAQAHRTMQHRNVRLDGTKVTREMVASCTGCSMQNADLRGADLHGLRIAADDFSGADMRDVNLAGARLTEVSLARTNLTGADLRGASLTGVVLDGTILEHALLDGVTLTGVSLQRLVARGAALRSLFANCTGCDLSGMDLRGQDLHGIMLSGADLNHADLRDANLRGVHFLGVDLSGVKLDGADLNGARFEGCDLSGASMRNAKTAGMSMLGSGMDG